MFMGYTKNSMSGFSWQTILKIFSAAVVLGKIMVVARILTPSDFGIFALVAIALGLAESTTQTGINLTIIQSKRSIRYFIDTAWVISIIRGILIGIIMVVLGMFMSNFYNEQSLTILIAFAALIPIIKGFINPSIVLYHKNLQFFKDSAYRFSLVVVDSIFAIIFAILFKSVIALILAMLVAAIFEVLISFILFKEKPVFNYLSSRAKIIFSNARPLSVSAVLSYLNNNIDDFLLGRIIGTFNLGLYHNAYSLSHRANYDFAKSIHHSILPVFTKITDDLSRLKRAFMRSMAVTIIVVVGVSLPLYIAPEFFVKLILGDQWLSIIPVLHLFVTAGIIHSISSTAYALFLAKKVYLPVNLHLSASLVILVPLVLFLAPIYGLFGAGQALIISRLLTLPIIGYYTLKLFKK
jgi:O-antigen/teichoic acid export membrane protein